MNTKNIETIKRLDKAISGEDINEINNILDEINDIDYEPNIDVEDIIKRAKNSSKEENGMKKKLSFKICAVVAAVVAVTGVSVGAATLIKQFSFYKDGSYVTVSSNSDINQEEAEKLADDTLSYDKDAEKLREEGVIVQKAEYDDFKSIEEAEKKYNMNIVMPEAMPDLEISEIKGSEMYTGENSKSSTLWITYGDANKKSYFMTITKNDFDEKEDITSITTNDVDDGGESITNKNGVEFNVFKESDEKGERTAIMYEVNKNEYEYVLGFVGFENNEIDEVLNSFKF